MEKPKVAQRNVSEAMLKNEEEFNNFMHRVTEVHKIVTHLSSNDKLLNEMGKAEADQYLKEENEHTFTDKIDENSIEYKIKCNKTLINKCHEENTNQDQMSQEAFMKQVEKDAKKRFEDKKIRKEKSDTLKTQANKAFRRGEYEKALSLYNKSIDLIRDSCVLYTNRALTYMHLKFYDKAIQDCETALKLNEDSLKAWLYLADSWHNCGKTDKSKECVNEAMTRHPKDLELICKYVTEFQKKNV